MRAYLRQRAFSELRSGAGAGEPESHSGGESSIISWRAALAEPNASQRRVTDEGESGPTRDHKAWLVRLCSSANPR